MSIHRLLEWNPPSPKVSTPLSVEVRRRATFLCQQGDLLVNGRTEVNRFQNLLKLTSCSSAPSWKRIYCVRRGLWPEVIGRFVLEVTKANSVRNCLAQCNLVVASRHIGVAVVIKGAVYNDP